MVALQKSGFSVQSALYRNDPFTVDAQLFELPRADLERAVQSASLKHAPPPSKLMTNSDGSVP